ncbi:prepilin peptidase [Cellulosimicrobium cellulans]|uniref:prepilin peptidase n=1 Tax=Cellulosimicrobium cellulans TaxID=1710 RepID=UPI00209BAB63|nr:A24 family peptidase [Cellulosimicrobium cellulans]
MTQSTVVARDPWRVRLRTEIRVGGRTGAVMALAAGAAAAWWSGPAWHTPAVVLVAVAAAVLSVVDARTHRLPDAIVLPAWAGSLLLLAVAGLVTGDVANLVRAGAGGAVAFTAYAALRLAYPPGLGFGDVKLAGLLGTALGWFGWSALVVGLLVPFLLGGAWAVALLALRRASRTTAVPFGPFMVLGAALGVLAGDAVLAAYAFA